MYSLAKDKGFSLETPWEKLPEATRNEILYGIERKIALVVPPGASPRFAASSIP